MTRSELIDLLAQRFPQLVLKDAELSVKTILDAMTENLSTGERIETETRPRLLREAAVGNIGQWAKA